MFSIACTLFIVMHVFIFVMTFSCAKTVGMLWMPPVIMSSGKIIYRDKWHSNYNLKATTFVIPWPIVSPTLDPSCLQQQCYAVWWSRLSGFLPPASPWGGCMLHNAAPTNHKMFMRGCRWRKLSPPGTCLDLIKNTHAAACVHARTQTMEVAGVPFYWANCRWPWW